MQSIGLQETVQADADSAKHLSN